MWDCFSSCSLNFFSLYFSNADPSVPMFLLDLRCLLVKMGVNLLKIYKKNVKVIEQNQTR